MDMKTLGDLFIATATMVVKGVASEAVKDVYGKLKGLFFKKAGPESDLEVAVEQLEKKIDSSRWQQLLRDGLEEAGPAMISAEVSEAAGLLLQLLDKAGSSTVAGERGVAGTIKDSTVVTGDKNRIIQAEVYNEYQTGNQNGREDLAAQAERRYLARLRQQCNVLPLAAMGGDEDCSEEIGLDQVYVELNTKTMTNLTVGGKRQHRQEGRNDFVQEHDKRPLKALEATAIFRQVVLVGDPGSGKSTFVKQLAANLAAARLGEKEAPAGWEDKPFPLLLDFQDLVTPLKELFLDGQSEKKQSERMAEIVFSQWQAFFERVHAQDLADMLEQSLDDGLVLMVFDGLDEVPEDLRGRARQTVQAVRRNYSKKNRVIVTCRIRSYQDENNKLPGFGEHALAPFSEEQIVDFTSAWYKAQAKLDRLAGNTDPAERAKNLQNAALSKDLKELSGNPLLLTTMAIIHQKETELPRQRVRLYDMAVEVLLSRWQKQKGRFVVSEGLDALLKNYQVLRTMMEHLAYLAHKKEAEAFGVTMLNRGELLSFLEQPEHLGTPRLADEFLDYIDHRAGILVGHGGEGDRYPRTYSFPHRTFQEYLAGCEMVSRRDNTREFWQRAEEGDFWAVAALLGAEELYHVRRGYVAQLDLAYSLCPADEPRDNGAWRAHLWSGQMAVIAGTDAVLRDTKAPDGGLAYRNRLIPRLCSLIRGDSLGPIERAEAGRVLARLGDPRKGVGLDRVDLPDIDWVEIREGAFIMGEDDEQYPHDVSYDYGISRYPVTNAQFQAFVDAKGYRIEKYWTAAMRAGFWNEEGFKGEYDESRRSAPYEFGEPFNLANHPVVGVTWYETLAFCAWLTEQMHKAGRLAKARIITLPNEPEWEKAARGEDGHIYPWGKDPDPNRANYDKTGIGSTSAVGCFSRGASPYGVEEMSGNVWEWTRSLWGKEWNKSDYGYSYEHGDGREDQGASADVLRVLRGGSFFYVGRYARCAYRPRLGPGNGYIGFRVVSPPHFNNPEL